MLAQDDNQVKRLQSIVGEIHDSPFMGVICVAGGGSEALAQLLTVPGASRTVIEALVPYHPGALADFLGGQPDQACSAKTARAMAMTAFQRAMRLEPDVEPGRLLGVGATAALATDRQRRGDNKVFVCVQSLSATREAALVLNETRTRGEEEALAARLVIDLLAEACGLPVDLAWQQSKVDGFSEHATPGLPAWQGLFTGERRSTHDQAAGPEVLFPGAFNPMHDGHRTMARLAETILGKPVTLEISAFNVDKPPLDYFDMAQRQAAIGAEYPLVFTRAPTFLEKSALFPGATFVIGVDTVKRIAEPRYYGDDMSACIAAIETIAERGNDFLVFGRQQDESFETLADVALPKALAVICHGVEEEMFRHDISSSELRGKTDS